MGKFCSRLRSKASSLPIGSFTHSLGMNAAKRRPVAEVVIDMTAPTRTFSVTGSLLSSHLTMVGRSFPSSRERLSRRSDRAVARAPRV